MKKLMLICSLACAFVLSSFALSAQNYVTASEAISVLESEIDELQSHSSSSNMLQIGASTNTRVKVAFYTDVLKGVTNTQSVSQAIENSVETFTEKFPARTQMVGDFKEEVSELLKS